MKTWRMADGGWRKGGAQSAGSSLIPHPSSLALCLVLVSGTALGQVANDPTRPPSGYATESAEPALESGGLTLQSILISPSHKAAIISGVMVKEGEKLGDATLVKVAESEVVLRTAGVNQVLKLYPGVDKREAGAADKGGARRGKPAGAGR